MKVNPIANVFSSISRSAAVWSRLPSSASASAGAAASSTATTAPSSASRKKKIVLASRCRLALVLGVVEEPHERAVEAEAEDDLGDDLEPAEDADDAVVLGAEVGDVDAEQELTIERDVASRRREVVESSRTRRTSAECR